MSNIMTKYLLTYVYKTIQTRAVIMNYDQQLPSLSHMSSLNKFNPSSEEIRNDYCKLSKHFKHPIYIDFVPSYEESNQCIKTAWLKRYLDTIIGYYNKKN